MFEHMLLDITTDHLIDKNNLLEDIKIRQDIYGITTEEICKIIIDAEELETDRYEDCWNCFDDSPCNDCNDKDDEIKKLELEITHLKEKYEKETE